MALYNLVRCYTNTTGQDNLTLGAAVTELLAGVVMVVERVA